QKPWFYFLQTVSSRNIVSAIVDKQGSDLLAMRVIDEGLRQFLVGCAARDASAVHRNRAALLRNHISDTRLVAHRESHIAVEGLGDPGVPGGEVLLEVRAVVPLHQRLLSKEQVTRLADFFRLRGIQRVAQFLERHPKDFARVIEKQDVAREAGIK